MSVSPVAAGAAIVPLVIAGLLLVQADRSSGPVAEITPLRMPFLPVTLFLGSYALSTLFSADPLQSLDAAVMLFPGLLVLYIYRGLGPAAGREILLYRGVAVMVTVASVLTIAARLTSGNGDPAEGFSLFESPALVVPNDVLLCVTWLPLVVAGISMERGRAGKLLPVLAIACCLAAVLLVRSRVCILALLLVVAMTAWLYRPRFLALALPVIAGLLWMTDHLLGLGIGQKFLESWLGNERLGIWAIGLAAVDDAPLLGSGPFMFETIYRTGIETVHLPAWVQVESRIVPWAHNLYLEALVERGILGLASLLFLALSLYLSYRQRIGPGHSGGIHFNRAMFVTLCTFLFAGLFELTLQRSWVVTSLFLLIAVYLVPSAGTEAKKTPGDTISSLDWPPILERYLWLTVPAAVVIGLLGMTADIDRKRVDGDVATYCQSLAASAKTATTESLAADAGSCRGAFRRLLEEQSEQFFRQAGNSETAAWLRARWWQINAPLSIIVLSLVAWPPLLAPACFAAWRRRHRPD